MNSEAGQQLEYLRAEKHNNALRGGHKDQLNGDRVKSAACTTM